MVEPTNGIKRKLSRQKCGYIMVEPAPSMKRELSKHSGTQGTLVHNGGAHTWNKERIVKALRYIIVEPTPRIKRELSWHSGT